MYQLGDRVVYGVHGVCRVANIEKQIVSRKAVTYLVLEPVGQDGARYLVPTSSEAAMSKLRPILTTKEMETLLQSEELRAGNWMQDETIRKQTYRELITSCDRAGLMRMIYILYHHKNAQLAAGKKFHLSDENFLRDAEKLLASEIAVVMEMQPDQARTYLRAQLKCE